MALQLPNWMSPWLDVARPVLEVALILLLAWSLRWLVRRFLARITQRYELPVEVTVGVGRVVSFLIGFAALLAVLQRFGVSGGVLWGAFTGFATVAAVAFFAAWSVLTNLFCAFLIMVTRPFRLHDHVELLESGEKPGLRGQVVDVTLVYVTLLETHAHGGSSVLRVPNSMFFQRAVRRWEPGAPAIALQAAEANNRGTGRRGQVAGGGAAAADDPD